MTTWLTFRDLKTKKGWPYSRQHTDSLVRDGLFIRPTKIPNGNLNLYSEAEYDAFVEKRLAARDARTDPNKK
jgi:hypothetical protein